MTIFKLETKIGYVLPPGPYFFMRRRPIQNPLRGRKLKISRVNAFSIRHQPCVSLFSV